ncbi:MAG: hypothetical protein QNJ42_22680 [Crocosphaera sp.]|nr:hypothetical protein [Crocosphaera sp.]
MSASDYDGIIHGFAVECAGVGLAAAGTPADLPLVTGSWVAMTLVIANQTGHTLSKDSVSKFVTTVIQGAGAYIVGSRVFTFLLNFVVPGFGTVGAASLNAALNWIYTFRFGREIAKRFERPNFSIDELSELALIFPQLIFPTPSVDEIRNALQQI